MWRPIVFAAVGLIVVGVVLYLTYKTGEQAAYRKMGYSPSWQRHHKEAAGIMADLGRVTSLDDPEYLRPTTRQRVDNWLAREEELINRGNRS